ncbi:MAG: class I SAM-dependent methyltransferase [Nocardioidaceae bacterium]
MSATDEIRDYWDTDAATYDRSASHHPSTPLQRSAWRGALSTLLPPTPAQRVLDVGAGTGFLSLLLSELGHEVTAADLSAQMLQQLSRKAAADERSITVVESDATHVPAGPYDVVVSRHLLWLLPDPHEALRRWRQSTVESGRLVLVDNLWGPSASPAERARRTGQLALSRLRGNPPAHHAELDPQIRAQLPLGHGPSPAELVDAVRAAGWEAPQLHRLAGVEWARRSELAWPERLLGVSPCFAVVAENTAARAGQP